MSDRDFYRRFLDAQVTLSEISDRESSKAHEANLHMWQSILDALILHRTEDIPIPTEMTLELEFELEHWVSGIPSQRLPLLTRPGRKRSPSVQ